MMDWVEKGMDGNVTILAPRMERVGKVESVPKARYGPAMLDMAFSDGPVQCDPDVCEELKKMYEFVRVRSQKDQARYKYIFDVSVRGVFRFLYFVAQSLFLCRSMVTHGLGVLNGSYPLMRSSSSLLSIPNGS